MRVSSIHNHAVFIWDPRGAHSRPVALFQKISIPLPPPQKFWLEPHPPPRELQFRFILSFKSLAFETTHSLKISIDLEWGDYGHFSGTGGGDSGTISGQCTLLVSLKCIHLQSAISQFSCEPSSQLEP